MQHEGTSDYGDLFRTTLSTITRSENLAPLLVDGLIVVVGGGCSLGLMAPALYRGYTAMALRAVRGEPVAVGDSLKGFEHFASSFVIGIILLALLVLGTIVPVVGNFAALVVSAWVWCVAVDRPDLGAFDTFKRSFELARDHLIDTVIVAAVGAGICTVLGATVIGLIFGVAFSVVLSAVFYRRWAT